MRHNDQRYIRLPGTRRGFLNGASLWLGPDHLLSVRRRGFSESYSRFYFADIQAIGVHHDPAAARLTGYWVFTGIAMALAAALIWTNRLAFIPLAVIVAALYLLYRFRRPNCTTFLQTAASTERLPALCRIRPARKAIARIEPLIREAQASISAPPAAPAVADEPAEAPQLPPPLAEPLPPPLPQFAAPPTVPTPLPPPLPTVVAPPQPSGLYLLAFGLTSLAGIAKIASAYSQSPLFTWLFPAGYLLIVAVLLIPLFRGQLAHLSARQLGPILSALIFAGLTGVYSLSFTVQRQSRAKTDPKVEQVYRAFESVTAFTVLPGIILLAVGIWGLVVFLKPARPADDASLSLFSANQS